MKFREYVIKIVSDLGAYIVSNLPDDVLMRDRRYNRMINRISDAQNRIIRLEFRRTQSRNKYEGVRNQLENLSEKKQRLQVELALLRMGRGESPSHFSCPEATGVLAERYERELTENARLDGEIRDLRLEMTAVNIRQHENLFDALNMAGSINNEFALLYLNQNGTSTRVSDNIGKIVGKSQGELGGLDFVELLNIFGRKDRRNLKKYWSEGGESYHLFHSVGEKKVDVMFYRPGCFYGTDAGTYVFVRKHKFRKGKNKTAPIFEAIEQLLHGGDRVSKPLAD